MQAPTSSFLAERRPSIAGLRALWRAHGDHLPCEVSDGRDFVSAAPIEPERFTALVIGLLLDPTDGATAEARALATDIARSAAAALAGADRVHFFLDPSRLPGDADCTAIAYLLLLRAGLAVEADAHRALDLIAGNLGPDGVVATYFDPTGERAGIVDAVVCANVMRLAWRLDRGDDVAPTWRYLRRVVRERSYLDGTRYYPAPACLLYSLALGRPFDELRQAVADRVGVTDQTLDLAQHVLAARHLGLDASVERARLAARVDVDGGCAAEGWFCYGRSRRWFGSRALSTAFVHAALAAP